MVFRYRKSTTSFCLQCGQEFSYKIYGEDRAKHYNRNQRFCSIKCGQDSQRTGHTDKHGYRVGKINGVLKTHHRVIMEDFLGRTLRPEETVHHKNGDRSDNRIENLEIWSSRHGKGQRVEDKIEFCRSFLQDYQVDAPYYSPSDAIRGISGIV